MLVMDESGSVGLDLSFTTHMFLLEPIPDRSLETQVVARAHRMGAISTVHVECLVMQVGHRLGHNFFYFWVEEQ